MARGGTVPRRGFLAGASALVVSGCTSSGADAPAPDRPDPTAPPAPPARVALTVVGATAVRGAAPADVWEDARTRPGVSVTVDGGTLEGVVVRVDGRSTATGGDAGDDDAPAGEVPGTLVDGTWTPTDPLELATAYRAVATATNADGEPARAEAVLRVVGEDGAVRAKMMPLDGERVGVGMPVVVYLTEPVADERRQALTDAMVVTGAGVEGAWRWFSATEAHWRPREYWPAGTEVRVTVPLTQVDVGAGRHGAADRDVTFTVGDAHTSVVDADAHRMTTSVNGVVAREFPVSCGREDDDPSFVTRSGVHLVLATHPEYLMDGATVGLDYETAVRWATRIANSGEFVHGAPWSVADQGVRNVSHGCVNASEADAKWFHDLSLRGDPVDVVGTDRPMELTNGLGDWTLSWEEWTSA